MRSAFAVARIGLVAACMVAAQAGETSESPKPDVLTLSAEEQAWLAQGHTVRVHVATNPPFMFVGHGEPAGIAIDYLRVAAEQAGIPLEWLYEPDSMGVAYDRVGQSNGPDLMPTTMVLERRKNSLSFTTPYLVSPIVIFTRDDH